ncbi:MAG: exodeoxyribonuclease VII large subunit [Lachnospiraceae bacterium]|nr:exodeoxyribonuclease VII large subunit [Lachnospiraceae bacterium]
MAGVYSVAQVNAYIKRMFNEDFVLNNISVSGEISNCKYHSSGHIYFTLKDEESVLLAVMFAGNARKLKFRLEEGMKVILKGKINVYERDGRYQIYVEDVALEGQGDLHKKFEQLKKDLEEMGMFDKIYKKPIPKYATKIGVVTASTGAAIQDIINITRRRNPYVKLYLYSAIVQGSEAAQSIVSGINCLDDMGLDVIIVGRGGGSIEDLWGFNEEIVARAIFNCNTPIISAVGHEVDFTIADFVSDMRAPTPSAAAELAVFEYDAFLERIASYEQSFKRLLVDKYEKKRMYLNTLTERLHYRSPKDRIQKKRQDADKIFDKIYQKLVIKVKNSRMRLSVDAEKLNGLSPLNKLSKGFGYISDETGKQVNSVENVKEGDRLQVYVSDGKMEVTVNNAVRKERFE